MLCALSRDPAAGNVQVSVELDGLGSHGIVGRGALAAPAAHARAESAHAAGRAASVIGPADRHVHGPAVEVGHIVAADALGTRAGAGNGERAVVHDEAQVGLDAGDAGQFAIDLAGGSGGLDGGHSAAEIDQRIGGKTFLSGSGDVDVDGSVAHDDGFLAPDAVSGAGGDFHVGCVHEADIVVGGDAGLAGGVYGQGTVAAEDQLALGEEGGLFVLVVRCFRVGGAVGEGVRAPHDHVGALVALVVDGGTLGIGKGEAAEENLLLPGAVQFEIPVG